MNGVHNLDPRLLLQHLPHSAEHISHWFPQVFPTMCRHQHEPAVRCPIQYRMGIIPADGVAQGINARVACHENPFPGAAFPQEIVRRVSGWRKVQPRDGGNCLPVKFLGKRAVHLVGSQTCLHVPHRNPAIKTGQRRRKGGRGISLHQHHVRLLPFQNILHPPQYVDCNIKQRLPLLHDGQLIIRGNAEGTQHIGQHLLMLAGDTDDGLKCRSFLQLPHQRAHLDSLWPGSKYEHHFFHAAALLITDGKRREAAPRCSNPISPYPAAGADFPESADALP